MTKDLAIRLISQLPNDATHLIIKGHDTEEIFFCSEFDCTQMHAEPAQKGSYKGPLKRWRFKELSLTAGPQLPTTRDREQNQDNDIFEGTPIDLNNLPTE